MTRTGSGAAAPCMTIAFVAALCLLAAGGRVSWWLPAWYAALSLIVFACYALDKSAAVRGARRIPERRLYLLAFAGGWPGALAGQRLLRHKTRKQRFQAWFAAAAAGNCALLAAAAWFLPAR